MNTAKRTAKPKATQEAPPVVKMRAIAAVRHGALRCAAGAVVDSDAEIVQRCPGSFEAVP